MTHYILTVSYTVSLLLTHALPLGHYQTRPRFLPILFRITTSCAGIENISHRTTHAHSRLVRNLAIGWTRWLMAASEDWKPKSAELLGMLAGVEGDEVFD